jgi:hypothetical protein
MVSILAAAEELTVVTVVSIVVIPAAREALFVLTRELSESMVIAMDEL